MARNICVFYIATLLMPSSSYAIPQYEESKSRLASLAPQWLEKYDVPSVAIAYIKNGELMWTSTFGEQSEATPATANTLYNIASLAKPILAELVIRLAEKNLLSLNEPLSKYWIDPDIAHDSRHKKLTPIITLSHRSGFPNWRYKTDGVLKFQAEPNTEFGYSGEGFEYTAKFLENKFSTSLENLVIEHIFNYFEMHNTAYTKKNWFKGRIAVPQGLEGKYGEPQIRTKAMASDDVYTTIEDYAIFLQRVMNRNGLTDNWANQRDSILTVMNKRPLCDLKQVVECPKAMGVGLGWIVLEYEKEKVLISMGSDWGENSMAFYFQKQKTGAVIFTNGANGRPLLLDVVDVLFNTPSFSKYFRTML